MVASCRQALAMAQRDNDFIRLGQEAFSGCESDSIDYAVMEHTRRAAVVPVSMGWSDVGCWDALWEMGAKDQSGNSIEGNVVAEDVRNCYLRSEAGLVAAIGVEDLVVVATADAVMVAPRNRTQDVKRLVARLVKDRRDDQEMMLSEDQSTYIPIGTAHRLENPGKIPLHLIEVQSGSYLGEDDIVRFEDSYGRS